MFHLADNASTLAAHHAGRGCTCSSALRPGRRRDDGAGPSTSTNTLLVPTMVNALVNFPGLDAQ